MELVQVATCTGPNFVHVATRTSQPLFVQVATCTDFLYKLQLVQNLNLYITYIMQFMVYPGSFI